MVSSHVTWVPKNFHLQAGGTCVPFAISEEQPEGGDRVQGLGFKFKDLGEMLLASTCTFLRFSSRAHEVIRKSTVSLPVSSGVHGACQHHFLYHLLQCGTT